MFVLEGNRQEVFPPVLAGLVTGGFTLVVARIPVDAASPAAMPAWAAPLVLAFPFVVSALWGWAWATGPARRLTLGMAVVTVGLMFWSLPVDVAWQTVTSVAAGLAAGWALGARARLDVGVLAVSICLAPLLIWTLVQMPAEEILEEVAAVSMQNMEQTVWHGLEEPELGRARDAFREQMDQAIATGVRIYPGFLMLGVLGQAGIILALVFWLARVGGRAPRLRAERSFTRWRLPFYLVWCLLAGLGLLLTRAPYLATAGLNVALVVALILSVQGLSVQAYFVSRLLSGPMQVLFWLIMGFVLFPVLLASSLGLGLADQWIDTRRRWEAREIE